MLGGRLKDERRRLGMTQAELGQLLGVGGSAIAMIEINRAGIDAYKLATLKEAGFDMDYLVLGKRRTVEIAHEIDWDLIFRVLRKLRERCEQHGVELTADQQKVITSELYLMAKLGRDIESDPSALDQLLQLAA